MTKGKHETNGKSNSGGADPSWRASGLSVRVSVPARAGATNFYVWARELRRVMPSGVRAGVHRGRRRAGSRRPRGRRAPPGRTVQVGPRFDAATLRRVVAVLEEGLPC
jgi:hypothetical protein